MTFVLRKELSGHSNDVRSVAASSDDRVFSGSRDGSVRQWHIDASGKDYSATFPDTDGGFVTSMIYADETVFTGSQDGKIRWYNLNPTSLVARMEGHLESVCKLSFDAKRGMLASASWDKTVRLWRKGIQVTELKGHELAVWSVLVLEGVEGSDNDVLPPLLTASADKSIRMWTEGKQSRTFQQHTDCVRDLAQVDAGSFLSCGNDGKVIWWSIADGSVRNTFSTNAYIYCLTILADKSHFASGGEDGMLRVWSFETGTSQICDLPTQSCWCVAALPNGDVACGSSDGYVRVFTRDQGRSAPADQMEAYRVNVDAFVQATMSQSEIGGIKVTDLPGPEILNTQGARPGQTKMVRDGRTVKLYEWSGESEEWTLVGDVLTGEEAGQGPPPGKTMYNGQEYDYVIDVDAAEGQPPLKLPYNRGSDPWVAAQEFLDKHMLPQGYLQTVAEFIIKNVGEQNVGTQQSNGFVDPFTGASSYKAGDASRPSGDQNNFSDPFTGGSRYTGGTKPGMGSQGAADPFTGGGRYVPSGGPVQPKSTDPLRPDSNLIPVLEFVVHKAINPKTFEKLSEFNALQQSPLTAQELEQLKDDRTSEMILISVFDRLLKWSPDHLVPVLDCLVSRITITALNERYLGDESLTQLLALFSAGSFGVSLSLCRLFSNAVTEQPGAQAVLDSLGLVLDKCGNFALRTTKVSAQSAFGQFLVNVGVLTQGTPAQKSHAFCQICEATKGWVSDVENSFTDTIVQSMLQCLGTLMFGDRSMINDAKSMHMIDSVRCLKDKTADEEFKHLARTIETMLS